MSTASRGIAHHFPFTKADLEEIIFWSNEDAETQKRTDRGAALWKGFWRGQAKELERDGRVRYGEMGEWCICMEHVYFDDLDEQKMIRAISIDPYCYHYISDYDTFDDYAKDKPIARILRKHRASHSLPMFAEDDIEILRDDGSLSSRFSDVSDADTSKSYQNENASSSNRSSETNTSGSFSSQAPLPAKGIPHQFPISPSEITRIAALFERQSRHERESLKNAPDGAILWKGFWRAESRKYENDGHPTQKGMNKWRHCMQRVYFDNPAEYQMMRYISKCGSGHYYNSDRDTIEGLPENWACIKVLRDHRAAHPFPTSADHGDVHRDAPPSPSDTSDRTSSLTNTLNDADSSFPARSGVDSSFNSKSFQSGSFDTASTASTDRGESFGEKQ